MTKRKRRRKIRRKPEPRIVVVPSELIESRISRELERASAILAGLNSINMLGSNYLVSAIYYHDGLLDRFNADRTNADPADRIVAHIARRLGPGAKRDFIGLLNDECALACSEFPASRLIVPVPYDPATGRKSAVHPYAIDLFAAEGTPVRSATRGLVVVADRGWRTGEWFSTSSVRGGNVVIVYEPDNTRFLRYAHLESVNAVPGVFVEAGELIGTVGHTGFNADRPGHGRHLHFEINEFANGVVTAVPNEELDALLEAARNCAIPPLLTPSA